MSVAIHIKGHAVVEINDVLSGPRYAGPMGPSALFGPIASVENPPRMEGRFLSMILVPNREAIAEVQKAERKAELAALAAEPATAQAAEAGEGAEGG